MSASTLADQITHSFYAWETRGRGWTLADYPVSLEPPFRPFFLLAPQATSPIDDGKRPTVASRVVERLGRLFGGTPESAEPPDEPYEEEPPFPALPRGRRVPLAIHLPREVDSHAALTAQFLSALSAALFPVSFEVFGHDGRVTLQIVADEADAEGVRDHIAAYYPDVAAMPVPDAVAAAWDVGAVQSALDVGLRDEFFLPLPSGGSFRADPFTPLIPACARTGTGEFLLYQVLFERVRNPWGSAIQRALDDGDGGCLIADAPWFLPAATEKTRTPLYAVTLRFLAQARSHERARILLSGTGAFLGQYESSRGNALLPLDGAPLPEDLHAESFLLRESLRTGMLLSAEELAGLVHLPGPGVPLSARAAPRTSPLPVAARNGALVLGAHEHRGERSLARLATETRFAHTWIIGGSGTGKSTLLAQMVLQDISAGHGVAVLDPHGDVVDDIIARVPENRRDRLIVFDPSDTDYPIGFNVLGARSEIERNVLASDLVAIMRRFATSWGDTMSTVLGEAVLALLDHPEGGTLLDLRRFLLDQSARQRYLGAEADPDVRRFWEKEYPLIGSRSIGPLIARLDAFLRSRILRSIVGQADARLDLGTVLASGGVLLVRLAKGLIGDENAYLLGSLIVAKVNQLALARQSVSPAERRAFYLYADEFQHFVTPSMESLATEGRKYRVGLVLAHQTLAQLSDAPRIESALLANCATRIVLRVGDGDARRLAEGFAHFDAADLSRLARGEAVARIGGAADDFNLRTLPLQPVAEEEAAALRAAARAASRSRYARSRAEVSAAMAEWQGVPIADTAPTTPTRTDAPMSEPVLREAPIAEGTAEERRPLPSPAVLRSSVAAPGRGGERHKYLQHLIKRLGEERGFRAEIEGKAEDGRADVVLYRDDLVVGCEISITTDVAHEMENLRKCAAAGFSRILFVAAEARQREKVSVAVRKELPDAPIEILGPEDVVATLDGFGALMAPQETVVRGYKVKVTRQSLSPDDLLSRRRAVAGVIARSMGR